MHVDKLAVMRGPGAGNPEGEREIEIRIDWIRA